MILIISLKILGVGSTPGKTGWFFSEMKKKKYQYVVSEWNLLSEDNWAKPNELQPYLEEL